MSTPLQQYYASGGPFREARQSTYRYLATNVLSGALMGDCLPGYLDLSCLARAMPSNWRSWIMLRSKAATAPAPDWT